MFEKNGFRANAMLLACTLALSLSGVCAHAQSPSSANASTSNSPDASTGVNVSNDANASTAADKATGASSTTVPRTNALHPPEMALQASASSEVIEDTVTIVIAKDVQGKSQAAAGQTLAAALDVLMKKAKGDKSVQARTGSYRVWPESDGKGKLTGWRGHGEIILESQDFAAARTLAATMSDDAAISNISFSLSQKARDAEERKLLTRVAESFRVRAQAASTAFGFSGYRIQRLELGGSGADNGSRPAPMMAMAARFKGAAAPAPEVPLEPNTETVSLSVRGTIVLR